MDVLQVLGVDCDQASRFVCSLNQSPSMTFVEAYGTGNLHRLAHDNFRNLNIEGLGAFDLRTSKPSGGHLDFNLTSDREEAREIVRTQKPLWIVGCPPCGSFCTWNTGINKARMDPTVRDQKLAEGRAHLRFVISLYNVQLSRGKHFPHEHPQGLLRGQSMRCPNCCRMSVLVL